MVEVDIPISLPDGSTLNGSSVVVIVGPNGSGKSRLARQLTSPRHPIEIVSASRSTRISPQLPVMSNLQARQQHDGQRNQARSNPWEQISDFDFVLAQLLSDDSDSARQYRAAAKAGESTAAIPQTALEQVDEIWQEVFEGRTLSWKDWAASVKNESVPISEYSASQMSDGERSALYLAAKVMLTVTGSILVVDEPENHFHSSLAVRLWKSLQARRGDLRFVFVTHDLTFATAQSDAVFLIAGATSGLQVLPIELSLPDELKRDILGAASFSYYASRVAFCEGTFESYDYQLFNAWFSGRDTQSWLQLVRATPSGNASGQYIMERS